MRQGCMDNGKVSQITSHEIEPKLDRAFPIPGVNNIHETTFAQMYCNEKNSMVLNI